jgi:hypothetical protein
MPNTNTGCIMLEKLQSLLIAVMILQKKQEKKKNRYRIGVYETGRAGKPRRPFDDRTDDGECFD